MQRERAAVKSDVESTNMSNFAVHPALDETATVQELISQHLAHEGYVETAKQFVRDVHEQKSSLSTDSVLIKALDPLEDVNAINRQSKCGKWRLFAQLTACQKYELQYWTVILTRRSST